MKYTITRVVLYWVYLYVLICAIQFSTRVLLAITLSTPFWIAFALECIATVVSVLLLSKWYFRRSEVPTAKEGAIVGLTSILFIVVISLLLFLSLLQLNIGDESLLSLWIFSGLPLLLFTQVTSWSIALLILLTTTYAGYEFDGTYTGVHK